MVKWFGILHSLINKTESGYENKIRHYTAVT